MTRPGTEMREVMFRAPVGDHVLGDDPAANELESTCAELLGKDWALFMPSGTMANQAAVIIGSRPATEVVVEQGAHLVHFEDAGAAAWAGVQLRAIPGAAGMLEPQALEEAIRPTDRFVPETSLVCFENTHNSAGGRVMSVEQMAVLTEVARRRGVAVHLDGARLPNAAIAQGRRMDEWAAFADTVMISLSKGLGAPIGSVLAGPARLFEAAWRARRRLGGGMRQAGMLAAAGLHALTHNFERLADDHRRARSLATELEGMEDVSVSSPETNIVMLDLNRSPAQVSTIASSLADAGVLLSRFGPARLRAVTHLDVDDEDLERAVRAIRNVCSASPGST